MCMPPDDISILIFASNTSENHRLSFRGIERQFVTLEPSVDFIEFPDQSNFDIFNIAVFNKNGRIVTQVGPLGPVLCWMQVD